MRRKRATLAAPATAGSVALQRACDCGQHVPGGGACPVCREDSSLEQGPHTSVQRALFSPAHPIDAPTRRDMESRFGRDFSRVRLHTDVAAAESATAVSALAYTVGQDVVFGDDRYAPATAAGRRLLAHELAHTIQQGDRTGNGVLAVGAPGGAAEHEAEQVTDRVMASGRPAAGEALGTLRNAGSARLQREPIPGSTVTPPPVKTPAPAPGTTTPAPTPSATQSPQAEIVDKTIEFFEVSAKHWALTPLDQALFDETITKWYLMVVDAERIIDSDLNSDKALRQRLRDAYIAAIRILMSAAARDLKTPEADLYRRNSGRIPMWAWLKPHHMEAGISTPIAEGRTADKSGQVAFASKGFRMVIAPDGADPALADRAETHIDIDWGFLSFQTGPPRPVLRIQTFYGPAATKTGPSGYGRGTTPEDVAGGTVDPRSTQLEFHEGSHGLEAVAYVESHPPPRYTGIGMKPPQRDAAVATLRKARTAYVAALLRDGELRTHCVGKTIDTYDSEHATPGQKIVLRCP
jgi:hypothetical protein